MRVGLPGVPQSMRIFSCRVRREGPDFRTFVTEDRGEWRCLYKDCSTAQDARQRSKSAGAVYCQHISSVREELSSDFEASKELAPVLGEASVIPELPFPPSIMSDLHNLKESASSLIERVSSECLTRNLKVISSTISLSAGGHLSATGQERPCTWQMQSTRAFTRFGCVEGTPM